MLNFRKSDKPLTWNLSNISDHPSPISGHPGTAVFAYKENAENILKAINEQTHFKAHMTYTDYSWARISTQNLIGVLYGVAITFDTESDEAEFIIQASDGLDVTFQYFYNNW